MGWSSEEEESTKKGMETSSKILLAIIACVLLIIILIIVLLLNIQQNTFNISLDGQPVTASKDNLITKIDSITYINIEEFAKLVKYEYHEGEYKAFTIEQDKCYVQGANETATFYLNDNKVCKLPVNDLTSDYQEFTVENMVKEVNGKMYASIEAINLAFNVVVDETEKSLKIYTLDYLVNTFDKKVKEWGYTGIADQDFENQKSLLYGYLIVKKENGLYKIIDNQNTEEIVSDKYNSIQFNENTKEFFVTNSLEQVGIINLDGTTKIEPVYESISVLDKKSDLYLIQKDKKYGVVKSGNITIIYPEYDSIGLNTKDITTNIENQYLILDTLIPVCKNNKWGAYDKSGNMVFKIEYDGFGCSLTTAEINGTKKSVNSVLAIEECNGVVVKKDEKYGILDINGKELVPIAVDNIYEIENTENKSSKYYMLYKNEELDIIERLIAAGLLEDKNSKKENNNTTTNIINNNTVQTNAPVANSTTNEISNQIANNNIVQ